MYILLWKKQLVTPPPPLFLSLSETNSPFLYEISTEDSTQTLVQMRVFHSPTLVVVPPLAPIIHEGVDQATTWKREASARHPRESLAHPEAYPQHAMTTVSCV